MKTKIFRLTTTCLAFIALQTTLRAQDIELEGLYKEKKKSPIEDMAFDRMVSQHITYAITGEEVPTSGIKVDLTKATGTLTGYLVNENGFDLLVDLGLGITEGSAALFDSQRQLHSDFSATFNFVFTPKISSARMYPVAADIIRPSWPHYKTFINRNKSDSLFAVILIIKANKLRLTRGSGVKYEFSPENYFREQILNSTNKKRKEVIDTIQSILAYESKLTSDGFTKEDTLKLSASRKQLLRELSKRYFSDSVKTKDLIQMYDAISTVNGRPDLMLSDLIATMNHVLNEADQNINYQIKLAEKYWTVKNVKWFTVSPFIRRQGFALYEQNALQRKDTSSLTIGLGARLNQLIEWKRGLFYWKGGLDVFRANNLSDFTKIDFVQRDSITSANGKFLYKEKSGTAYSGSTFDHDMGIAFSVEAYLFLSRRNFFPGIYMKYDVIHSKC
jgi:hypothetical protein